ncbi:ATP-binding protein [Treponema primitia]|uniref:ATP-binding protein n=1 Tax=Treponema primitia TaxID=88058 RepID=UPI0002554E60|nr:ATP-binding protein [Treponema primitia]
MENKELNEMTLLDSIGQILEFSKDSGLSKTFFEAAKDHLNFVSNELHITPIQAALFAHIFDSSIAGSQYMGDHLFIESLKCTKVQYLEYLNDIDELVNINYVTQIIQHDVSPTYRIPREIIFALRKGKVIKPENYINISIGKLFSVLKKTFLRRYNDALVYDEFMALLSFLLDNNQHLEFVKLIKGYNLLLADAALLLYFCHKHVASPYYYMDDTVINFDSIRKEFGNEDDPIFADMQFIDPLRNGNHRLQELGLVENANNNGYAMGDVFCLTDKAVDMLLKEIIVKKPGNNQNMILCNDIPEKTLYYNADQNDKVQNLIDLLLPLNFKGVEKRLKEKGMRNGFACLFSGLPGTGKTETVYQIAKKTGRDILQVDISEIKSKWVGESEKQIKKIFTDYKKQLESVDTAPILLFNEADAIIGQRMNFNGNSHAVDQMENTIQNIILQELEDLSGILIATTNLTKNMDKAFERRFLYKIEFEKPELEAKKSIWQSMIPELSENDAALLAIRFDFSGGQIENIARKRTVDEILTGAAPSIEQLLAYCRDEVVVTDTVQRIGFAA